MTLTQTKPASRSLGVWGGAVAALAGLGGLVGLSVTPDQAAEIGAQADGIAAGVGQLVQAATSLFAMIGGALALWGRLRAQARIGKAAAPGSGPDTGG
jgi:hypothetical protein